MREGMKIGENSCVEVTRGDPFPMGEGFIIKQKVEVDLKGPDGELKWREETHNIVTTLGLQYVADAILRGSAAKPAMAGMELGTGTTNPAVGDTDVETAVTTTGGYQAFDSGYPQQTTASTIFKVTFAAGEATQDAITESAIKSSTGATDAISRIEFTAVNKDAADTLAVTVTWTFS